MQLTVGAAYPVATERQGRLFEGGQGSGAREEA